LISLFSLLYPFNIPIVPPTAIVSLCSINDDIALVIAFGSKRESASIQQKRGYFDIFIPQFRASAFPPFCLSTTIKFLYVLE